MKKHLSLLIALTLSLVLLAGCTKPAVYQDGTFTSVSDADDKGYVRAEVTIKGDKIDAVKIVGVDNLGKDKTEAYPYADYHTSIVELADAMKENNTWDVDGIAKATGTSEQARQAAKRAMEKALVKPESSAKYFDGKFMAISEEQPNGWTIAWVKVENDTITEVEIVSTTQDDGGNWVRKDDTYPWEPYFEAVSLIPERIVANNGTDIDTVTGATGTSTQAIEAVNTALELGAR